MLNQSVTRKEESCDFSNLCNLGNHDFVHHTSLLSGHTFAWNISKILPQHDSAGKVAVPLSSIAPAASATVSATGVTAASVAPPSAGVVATVVVAVSTVGRSITSGIIPARADLAFLKRHGHDEKQHE
jgi:hypothetical protein